MNNTYDFTGGSHLEPDYSLPPDPDKEIREVKRATEDCALKLESIERDMSHTTELLQSVKADIESIRYTVPGKIDSASGSASIPLWLIAGMLAWVIFFK